MSGVLPSDDSTGKTHTLVEGAPAAPGLGSGTAVLVRSESGVEIAVLAPGVPLVIGRAPASGLRVEDRTLSREHARFELIDDRVVVEDLGSKNGTSRGGRRVQRCELEVGDDVVLGAVHVAIQALGASGESLGLDGEEAFRRHLDEEQARAVHFGRPFALVLARAVDERGADPPPRDRGWLEAVRERVRAVDRIAPYGPAAVHVLLPETGPEEASRIAHTLARPGRKGTLRFLVGVAVHAGTAVTGDELMERAGRAARDATLEQPVAFAPTAAWPIAREDRADMVAGPAMQAVIETALRVASSRIPVILHGETGTGKELLARLLHERSPRSSRRIVRVNCGAIPKDLLESTLFGHEKGAFTGAVQLHKGIFEEADGGTVFLDEIGELPLAAQAALLRVLETGMFTRVGSSREIAVDVRIVAATHRDLEAMAASGAFRADLYYRLGGAVLDIPPLRERRDEIEPLALRFLRVANEANHRGVRGIDAEAMELLRAYPWPGNVRELRNAVERAVVVARALVIGAHDLPARVRQARNDEAPPAPAEPLSSPPESPPRSPRSSPRKDPAEGGAAAARDAVQQYEARIVRDALEAAGWNRTEAARKLGMPVRTLSYRMKVLGIKKPGT